MTTDPTQPDMTIPNPSGLPDYHGDASFFQNVSGAAAADNPYMPFLQPKVVTNPDGTKVLRIPKNQQLLDLAKFFDAHGKQQFNTAKDLATSYLDFLQKGSGGRDAQKLAYDTNKPYFKPTAPKSVTDPSTKALAVKKTTTPNGGIAFFQKQKDGTSKPITAAEYAHVTGQSVTDILSKSKDPNDAKIIDDTNQLQSQVDAGTITLDQALTALRSDYPHVYGSSN